MSTAAVIPDELASLLRSGRALAVHADDGSGIFPGGAASVQGVEISATLARQLAATAPALPANGGAVLVDLPLGGLATPPVACACRLLMTPDGERAIVIVPLNDWQPARAPRVAPAPAPDVDGAMTAISDALRAQLATPEAQKPTPIQSAPAPLSQPPADSGGMGATEPVRILWQSDSEGKITQAGTRLQALLGPQAGTIIGRTWRDLEGDVFIDSTNALTGVLAARSTGSKIPLLWSADNALGPVDVEWSALPIYDRNRTFQGFRGFLLVHPPHADEEMTPQDNAVVTRHAPAAEKSPTMADATPTLSQSERAAFRELARALGARHIPEPAKPTEESPVVIAPRAVQDMPLAAQSEPVLAGYKPALSAGGAIEAHASPEGATLADAAQDSTAQDSAIQVNAAQDQFIQENAKSEIVIEEKTAFENTALPAVAPEAAPDESITQTVTESVAESTEQVEQPPVAAPADSRPEPAARAAEPVVVPAPVTHIVRVPDPRYQDMIERLPIGVLVNRSNRVLFANRTLLDLLDYNSVADITEAGGTQALFRGRIPISEKDGPSGGVLLTARDGERIAVDARLQNIHWDGEPATLVSFRRSAEIEMGQKLRAAESELKSRETQLRETRAILDTTTDGVAVLDEAGRILSINRAAEALFGYDQKEMAGDAITELIAPESRNSVLDYFEGLKSGGIRAVFNDGREVTGRVRQGGRIPIFLSFGQLTDKPERKFCAVMRDLTAWKKSERELVDARKFAENASAQKSDFLAKISHEVRTPLNAIIGFAEVMMEERFGAVGNERYKEYLKDIHASGTHVISLVNDLLDLSKIEAGKMELDFASVNVNEVVRGVVSIMQPQSQRGRIVIRSAMTTKLPAIIADERALKQIVLNLLSNAVKFTDPGGQVIVSTTMSDLGEVVIRIRDTGVGMTPQEIEQAMEPFKQLSSGRRAGGTGLGLPLTKALVEANRAAMRISSVKNEGTLIEIVFPPTRVMADH